MKRWCFIFVMLTLFTGCTLNNMNEGMEYFAESQTELKRSQIPTITVDGQKVPVLRGEIRPEQLGNTQPAPVKAGGTLEIKFEYAPQNSLIRLQQWHNGTHTWKTIKGNQFTLPSEKGLYLYTFHLNWGQHDDLTGSYSIFLEAR
ncbi:hypothetical protein CathTA2_1750 [Caldalkalibacillus thermarum TA2.A1]|uniref:Lipoprotein n=1 Tax=Caldalkalibacillus thermarum (strain TA2.A1) TaxID=986075 RepID=F5L7F0_CALTT|nr:hypothetical protein [Caldalkalibacillus thermarum]EGL82742.1 hypothetical protein CathTA2_1750 [Caldalkalibacillus thermarum TA2.A1]QZT32560.1 hypothetical protein HUR95_09085 [Caldalkalibacillus thermarum TA2.A1]